MKISLQSWSRLFYALLLITFLPPFISYYYKIMKPSILTRRTASLYNRKVAEHDMKGLRIRSGNIQTALTSPNISMRAIGQSGNRVDIVSQSPSDYSLYYGHNESIVDYYNGESETTSVFEINDRSNATSKDTKLAENASKSRKLWLNGKFRKGAPPWKAKTNLTAQRVSLWHLMEDTNTTCSVDLLSTDEKAVLMRKYYPHLLQELTKPRLPAYKTPCFCQSHGSTSCQKAWGCLPYFYLVGAPKSGTTDLWYQLQRHPAIALSKKEPHWWTRHSKEVPNIFAYFENQRSIVKHAVRAKQKSQMIIGDGSASTLWDNVLIMKKSVSTTQQLSLPFTWADVISTVQPDAKVIAILRNPVTRVISDYFAFYDNPSPDNFHKLLQDALQKFKDCLKKYDLRFCANLPYRPRIQIGLYIVHIAEWFGVFPREQVFILRTEDWYLHHQQKILPKIFEFLEIEPLPEDSLPILKKRATNILQKKSVTKKNSEIYGNILPESKLLLKKFYTPYNKVLAELLRDPRYLWIDGPPI